MNTDDRVLVRDISEEIGTYCCSVTRVLETVQGTAYLFDPSADVAGDFVTYAHVFMYLASALDHLEALKLLFQPEAVPRNACFTMARTVVEASCRALWLLDTDATSQQRLARALLVGVNNIEEGRRVDPDSPRWENELAEIKKRARAADAGISYNRANRISAISEERWLSTTGVTGTYLSRVSGLSTQQGWVFRYLSGHAHALPYAQVSIAHPAHDDAGHPLLWVAPRLTQIVVVAYLAIIANAAAVAGLAELCGGLDVAAVRSALESMTEILSPILLPS